MPSPVTCAKVWPWFKVTPARASKVWITPEIGDVIVTVPFVLPTVVVGAAFLALLPDSLDQSVTAILLAHVFFNVAVVVRGVGGMWEQLPTDLSAAARTLGASPW